MKYKADDKIIFKIGQETLTYQVVGDLNRRWFLAIRKSSDHHLNNRAIFDLLGINDPLSFVSNISKYTILSNTTLFPEINYPDETEINKVIDALLEKCNEYNKLNNVPMCYNREDKIVFKLPDKEYHYHVSKDTAFSIPHWFLSSDDMIGDNDQIIDALNITDKEQFCKDVSGCDISSGQFPEIKCLDSTGISKVINKLMEMCEEKMKESLKIKLPQLLFLDKLQLKYPFIDGVPKITNSETKMVLKKSTPKYKLKFTN